MASPSPDPVRDFREIVLRGANVASYKFALAKALLEFAGTGQEAVPLEELAVPFSREICMHLQAVDTQSTSRGSRFLDACRHFNSGVITSEELVTTTALLGFANVIDAFHVVDSADVGTRFFVDERRLGLRGVRLTDDLLATETNTDQRTTLGSEAESRWALVESAWDERRTNGTMLRVAYDRPSEMIVRGMLGHRRPLTWVRPSLSGYQASQCFYCGTAVSPLLGLSLAGDGPMPITLGMARPGGAPTS